MDNESMRMIAVSIPGTVSFGSILADLGVSSMESMGDIITVTSTTVVYVPAVEGASGEKLLVLLGMSNCP